MPVQGLFYIGPAFRWTSLIFPMSGGDFPYLNVAALIKPKARFRDGLMPIA
jgi:hypothetical protein